MELTFLEYLINDKLFHMKTQAKVNRNCVPNNLEQIKIEDSKFKKYNKNTNLSI